MRMRNEAVWRRRSSPRSSPSTVMLMLTLTLIQSAGWMLAVVPAEDIPAEVRHESHSSAAITRTNERVEDKNAVAAHAGGGRGLPAEDRDVWRSVNELSLSFGPGPSRSGAAGGRLSCGHAITGVED